MKSLTDYGLRKFMSFGTAKNVDDNWDAIPYVHGYSYGYDKGYLEGKEEGLKQGKDERNGLLVSWYAMLFMLIFVMFCLFKAKGWL